MNKNTLVYKTVLIPFLFWWAFQIPKKYFSNIFYIMDHVYHSFSPGSLLRTLFSPWKGIDANIQKTGSLDQKMASLRDNLFSRFFGFISRVFFLIFFIITESVIFVLGITLTFVWILLPIISFLGVYQGIILVAN